MSKKNQTTVNTVNVEFLLYKEVKAAFVIESINLKTFGFMILGFCKTNLFKLPTVNSGEDIQVCIDGSIYDSVPYKKIKGSDFLVDVIVNSIKYAIAQHFVDETYQIHDLDVLKLVGAKNPVTIFTYAKLCAKQMEGFALSDKIEIKGLKPIQRANAEARIEDKAVLTSALDQEKKARDEAKARADKKKAEKEQQKLLGK
jgi:hypothetical protein